MKSFLAFLAVLALSFSLSAAETSPPKKSPEKPSAKVEAVAKTLVTQQRAQLLTLLNQGDLAALMAIPGIGEVRAKAIQKARPLADVTNVVSVDGIGEGIFAQMVAYAKAGFPQPEKKAPAKKKSAPKKADTPSSK
ncbi:ComEA family DNA-binding protein [Prosthecobacter sp.]|jgi:DNA uptake protein ComE-like DNA-binding protein|uniref:ComEA family DNA-binding protein n=1 Tax=Prosthecobacter sp. TaxID=1965333 RepID=UPI0037C6DB4D